MDLEYIIECVITCKWAIAYMEGQIERLAISYRIESRKKNNITKSN